MVDQNTADLPEGTDTIIEGAANVGSITTDRAGGDDDGGILTIEDTDMATESSGSRASGEGLAGRLRTGREKLASQAGD